MSVDIDFVLDLQKLEAPARGDAIITGCSLLCGHTCSMSSIVE
jgi:hypothetical protein